MKIGKIKGSREFFNDFNQMFPSIIGIRTGSLVEVINYTNIDSNIGEYMVESECFENIDETESIPNYTIKVTKLITDNIITFNFIFERVK